MVSVSVSITVFLFEFMKHDSIRDCLDIKSISWRMKELCHLSSSGSSTIQLHPLNLLVVNF